MKYERPPYGVPGVPTVRQKSLRPGPQPELPKFELPVTPKENFRLAAARRTPYWMPMSVTDDQYLMAQDLVTGNVRGMQCSADVSKIPTENYTFNDWFNTNWTWVVSAGGPMLTPGSCLCGDITNWERDVVFPDLGEWDFKSVADSFLRNVYDPDKNLHINIGQGLTERLISVVGGYTEGLLALAVEPEAVRAFLDRFAEFTIAYIDLICTLYPVDMITYHDDWGTEKDTFFSEKMMEEIVFEPTKRIVGHIKSKGVMFEFHCCGNVGRFIPYMIELKMDFLQLQRRANDLPAMKAKYGEKIGFNLFIEDFDFTKPYTRDEVREKLRRTVDLYGRGGGAYINIFEHDPEKAWNMVSEVYAYSREFYDRERGE